MEPQIIFHFMNYICHPFLFFNILPSYVTGSKEKHRSTILLLFVIMILGWFLNLFRAFVTWSLVIIKPVSYLWLVGIFKFGAILIKNYWKLLLPAGLPEITFQKLFAVAILRKQFLISVILHVICILSENKGFTVFQNV